MPKRLSAGHLVRRVRRSLEKQGCTAQVNLIAPPLDIRWMSPVVCEVTAAFGGRTCVSHHAIRAPYSPEDAARIVSASNPQVKPLLPSTDEVQAILDAQEAQIGSTLDRSYMVHRSDGSSPHVYRPVVYHRMDGKPGNAILSWRNGDHAHRPVTEQQNACLSIERARRRALRRGHQVDGPLALVLLCHPQRREIAGQLREALTRALDACAPSQDWMTVFQVDEVRFDIAGLCIEVRSGIFTLTSHEVAIQPHRIAFERGTLKVEGAHVPLQVVTALPGRALTEVIAGLPLPEGTRIKSARRTKKGLSIVLESKRIGLEALITRLSVASRAAA